MTETPYYTNQQKGSATLRNNDLSTLIALAICIGLLPMGVPLPVMAADYTYDSGTDMYNFTQLTEDVWIILDNNSSTVFVNLPETANETTDDIPKITFTINTHDPNITINGTDDVDYNLDINIIPGLKRKVENGSTSKVDEVRYTPCHDQTIAIKPAENAKNAVLMSDYDEK